MKKEDIKIKNNSLPIEPEKLKEQMARKAKKIVNIICKRRGDQKRSE